MNRRNALGGPMWLLGRAAAISCALQVRQNWSQADASFSPASRATETGPARCSRVGMQRPRSTLCAGASSVKALTPAITSVAAGRGSSSETADLRAPANVGTCDGRDVCGLHAADRPGTSQQRVSPVETRGPTSSLPDRVGQGLARPKPPMLRLADGLWSVQQRGTVSGRKRFCSLFSAGP